MKITFTPLAESHFPLLLKWLETPHVKAWWPADRSFSVGGDQHVKWTPALIEEKYAAYVKGYKLDNGVAKTISAHIIYADNTPIGYIQIYNAYDFARGEPLIDLPSSLAAFDVFIGDEAYLKQGIGSGAITQFLKEHGASYTHVFADPEKINLAAIRAYKKAGFRKCKKQPSTDEVWMILNNKVVSVNNAEHFVWGDICDGWWLKKDNNFTVIEETMPPGGLEVKHVHNITEQFFYVLSGSLFIEMNNHEHQIKSNQGLTIPVGVAHQAFNKSKEAVRFLVISCPDSHSDRINVEDSKPASNLDNEPIFSDISDPTFDNKIDKALRHECGKLTGINTRAC